MGTRLAKAVFGLSILPRWRKCRRSCTSGGARTPSVFAAAWRDQVGPSNASKADNIKRRLYSDGPLLNLTSSYLIHN